MSKTAIETVVDDFKRKDYYAMTTDLLTMYNAIKGTVLFSEQSSE